ncbi:MAG: hypothetical protein AB1894_27250 [Chloroflexota bacterium]
MNKTLFPEMRYGERKDHQSLSTPVSYLAQDYKNWNTLYDAQTLLIQSFFAMQARQIADALTHKNSQVRFSLPDQVSCGEEGVPQTVPLQEREQLAGGFLDRLARASLQLTLRQRLDELEASEYPAISTSAGLLRFAIAMYLVRDMLPDGRSVTYQTTEGEEIPSIPVGGDLQSDSAITSLSDVIAEKQDFEESGEKDRGELVVPYVSAARRFFLPQWVAFDQQDQLLVSTMQEAETYIASMQEFLRILHMAVGLAPYLVTVEIYQRKRYGMLGQLINQGRALARYQTREIIKTIQQRAAAQDLNRGLGLSLPYFDDQVLEMKTYDFQVIPAGRIMFVPALVVRAARQEEAKVAQDTRLSPSTRKHVLVGLQMLEGTFN